MSSSARTKGADHRSVAPSRPGSRHEPIDRAAALDWAKANDVKATPRDTFQHRPNCQLPCPADEALKGGRVFGMREPAAECLVLARVHEAARPACRVVGDVIDVAVLATSYRPFIPRRPAASLAFCLAVGVSDGDILCTAALAPEVRCR